MFHNEKYSGQKCVIDLVAKRKHDLASGADREGSWRRIRQVDIGGGGRPELALEIQQQAEMVYPLVLGIQHVKGWIGGLGGNDLAEGGVGKHSRVWLVSWARITKHSRIFAAGGGKGHIALGALGDIAAVAQQVKVVPVKRQVDDVVERRRFFVKE